MRIAIIAPPWLPVPPPAYGGTELMVDALARGLQDRGHNVLLYTTGDSTCAVPRAFVYERARGVPASVPVELRHVIHAYSAAQGCDIVHDHTLTGLAYCAQFPDLRVVTTNHGLFDDELTDIYRAVAERVPIIAISHAQAAAAGDVPITRVIHHGIDVQRMPFGRGDGGYLLFLGRMSPDKGAHRAARIARAARVPLRIAAKMREPEERSYFEEQVVPLLGDGIEFVGEVDGNEKLRLLAGARALINPITWDEPFGLVMVEALACGTPVLSFPRGAAPEIVDNARTGFLCADDVAMIERVADVDGLDRATCRADAQARFSASRMVTEHLEVYEQIIDRAAGEPATYGRPSSLVRANGALVMRMTGT
jgi:glycosyltransferase involved in cell wall biosynthesis